MLEVLLRVSKIGLTLLEERFRLPEGELEEPFHLAACQRPFTVPLYGDGLEGASCDRENRTVHVLAIGVKDRDRLFIGGEEVEL